MPELEDESSEEEEDDVDPGEELAAETKRMTALHGKYYAMVDRMAPNISRVYPHATSLPMGLNFPVGDDPFRMLPEVVEYYSQQGLTFMALTQRKMAELRKVPGVTIEALRYALPLCERMAEALDAAFSEDGAAAALSPVLEILWRALYAQLVRLQPGMQDSAFAASIDGRVEEKGLPFLPAAFRKRAVTRARYDRKSLE